ncbi:hypothetical protein DUNSADRAFT_4556 [Dunaliella salina]|uniref:Uncharacterized protein n=1 Tax=Dunaliella salina TaxID=3046 RepID=A0ABQ7GRQ2_DUNSA|nr:hypothetical protein DUNSADRAFT_4556 [Dunaliella salina]|eukprot:KAF5837293.1 hypothetical protein DUNSADRAFT_4556 [Dunaliella salina]
MDMSWKAAHLPPAHISTNKSTLVSRPLRCCKRRSRRVAGATGRAAYEALDLHPVNPSAPALTPPTKPTAQPGTPRPAVQPNAAASGLDVLPVMTITTETLASQTSIAEAVAALAAHLPAVLAKYSPLASGVVRLEVPVARGATALQWLAGQELAPAAHEGDGGEAFDGAAVKQMQRFLSPDQPRVRILGGTRFNSGQTPSPEWQTFGAYLFVLPLLEYLEVEGGGVLAATLAWDSAVSEPMAPPSPEPAQPFFSASTSSSPPHHNQHAQQAGSSGSAVGMNAPSLSNTDDQNGVSSSSNMDRNDITSSASSSTERNGSSHSRSTASHAGKHKGGGNTNPSDRSSSPSSSSSFLRDAQETSSRSSRPCTPAGHLSARGTGAPSLGLAVAAAAEALQSLQPAAPRTAPAHHVQVRHNHTHPHPPPTFLHT